MINQPQQVDPLTGMPIEQALPVQQQVLPVQQQAQVQQQALPVQQQALPAQQQAQVPQVPSNELGSAAPVFNPRDQAVASRIYGDVQQKQNSVSPQFVKPTY